MSIKEHSCYGEGNGEQKKQDTCPQRTQQTTENEEIKR